MEGEILYEMSRFNFHGYAFANLDPSEQNFRSILAHILHSYCSERFQAGRVPGMVTGCVAKFPVQALPTEPMSILG